MRTKVAIFVASLVLIPIASVNMASAAVTATTIYSLGYPVGLAEDSAGNIYIADDHNADASKKGIVVIPAATGTLFGQAVTIGTPHTLVSVSNPAGIAISSTGTLVWALSNGNLYALASTARTVFGVSVPADTVTLIAAGTGLRGGLDFDSAGNLYGVYIATGTFSVFPIATGTLYGQAVTANSSTTLFSNDAYWFWDLALDSSGNIFLADGWGSEGIFVMPISTGTLYGQAVTANTFTRITSFGTIKYAGIDVDDSDVLYANQYGNITRAVTATAKLVFGIAIGANSVTDLNATSGYIDQGLLVTDNGDLITGGGSYTYRLSNTPDLTAPGAPTIGIATATSPTTATISFTAPANNGGASIETYTATSTPGSKAGRIFQSGSGVITISDLSPSTSYTFVVTASNSIGTSLASSATLIITTPASQEELAEQVAAALKAAQAARAAEIQAARSKLVTLANSKSEFTITDLSQADLSGANARNISLINSEIILIKDSNPIDIDKITKIVRKYALIDKISGKVSSFTFRDLEEIGIITNSERYKTSITISLRQMESEQIDTFEEIKSAVTAVQERFKSRSEALKAVQERIRARQSAQAGRAR
jgi:hypothetical protein